MLLAKVLNPGTLRLLNALGVSAGMRCLEVSRGSGSVTNWLCRQVGPGGSVLATDLDIGFLAELEHPNLEVREHDLLTDELPEQEFDLVHARLALAQLAEPEAGLERIVAALKPGGCLLLEELDFISLVPDPALDPHEYSVLSSVIDAHNAVLASQPSFDPYYGRRLAGELAAAGLVNSGCEGRSSFWYGGQAGGRVWQLSLLLLRDRVIASGLATAPQIDTALALCADPRMRFLSPVTVAAWGYRPLPADHLPSTLARG